MKPSKGFLITVFLMLGIVMVNIAIQSKFKKKILSSRLNRIMIYA